MYPIFYYGEFSKTDNGKRPVSPQSVFKLVERLTRSIERVNFVCNSSTSVALWVPQISAPKFKMDSTRVSNSLNFCSTGTSSI